MVKHSYTISLNGFIDACKLLANKRWNRFIRNTTVQSSNILHCGTTELDRNRVR